MTIKLSKTLIFIYELTQTYIIKKNSCGLMTRYEVRIAGYGGQGVITLSKMIITASSLYEGLAGTQTEAYSS